MRRDFFCDLEEVKQLLAEAGYPNGFEMDMIVTDRPLGAIRGTGGSHHVAGYRRRGHYSPVPLRGL